MTAKRRVAVGRLSFEGQSRWTKWHLRSTWATVREWAHVFRLTSPYAVAAQLGTVAGPLSEREGADILRPTCAKLQGTERDQTRVRVDASASSSRHRDAYLELQSDENKYNRMSTKVP